MAVKSKLTKKVTKAPTGKTAGKTTEEIVKEIEQSDDLELDPNVFKHDPKFDKVVSTGSTLLDLAISGKRIRGGGIPGGILVEIFGSSGAGKSLILCEVCLSAQINGGDIDYNDPEARLDVKRQIQNGLKLRIDGADKNYHQEGHVKEMFSIVEKFPITNTNAINVVATDSLAALVSDLEMSTSGDKRGQARAKEFSEGFRKYARIIAEQNRLLVCSNQIRESDYGDIATGGKAIGFYSGIRIKIKPAFQGGKIKRTVTLKDKFKSQEKIVAVKSECQIIKNDFDHPFREAPIFIDFEYGGIDDIRGNLMWLRDVTGATKYGHTLFEKASIEGAISEIEDNNLEEDLRNLTIDVWEEIEKSFETNRKPKIRR